MFPLFIRVRRHVGRQGIEETGSGMKSNAGGEVIPSPMTTPRPFLLLFACVLLFSVATAPVPARAAVSLAEMARIEAIEVLPHENTLSLFQGYLSLGLLPEAASLLDGRVRMGILTEAAAAPLFDALLDAQGRFGNTGHLLATCETAVRSGVRTPKVLYFLGTGLRSAPGPSGEASAILAQVEPGSPYYLLALYSLGQIAGNRRDVAAAEKFFRRVEQGAGDPGGSGNLTRRGARSRAEILIASGRGAEAGSVFQTLLHKGKLPLDRIGLAAAGTDPVPDLERLASGTIAELPLKERIQFHLLLGGLARESGRYELAVERLTQAGKELEEAISSASPPSPEHPAPSETLESLRLQIERLRSLRQGIASTDPLPEEGARADALEILAGLLVADRTVSRAAAETQSVGVRFLTPAEIAEVLRRIEEVVLGGIEVDRMVDRYRYLPRLKANQEEIHRLRKRIREGQSAAVDGGTSARDGDASLLLKDLGLYIKELHLIRSIPSEMRMFTRNDLDILRKKKREGEGNPFRQAALETVAYADGRIIELLPAVKSLEEGERIAAWKRRRPQWIALRAAVSRQLADALVAQARWLRQDPREESRKGSFTALEQAVSLLSGDRLAPPDAAAVAIQAGSLLAEGEGRWEPFPGQGAGEREKEMIARILPLLPAEAPSATRPEEPLYLQAALRMAVKDPGAGSAAGKFLEKYPASPLAAEIGIRLGHEAFLAGETELAVARYRAAEKAGNPEASAVARFMLAWVRFRGGDTDGTVRELAPPLSDPSFPCGDLSPFEQAILSLSVRAWRVSPLEKLDPYPPVKAGTCGGKVLLAALWEAEKKRGEAGRTAQVRDIVMRRYPSEDHAAALAMKTVEALLRSGRDREALARTIKLVGKYGPGSAWAMSRPAPVRESAAAELAGMLKTLSVKEFDAGIRTGDRSAMSAAAAGIEGYFDTRGGKRSGEDGELRLKWAIALLRSGDRKGGVLLLEELVGEQRGDATGERAAVFYAETSNAEDAEHAALLLLGERPSEKAVSLALRASSAFLEGREYGRGRRLAEVVEESRPATRAQVIQARLTQAEAAVFEGDPAAARGKAAAVLADPAAVGDPDIATRAKDLYLLASLKEVDRKIAVGDPKGAADLLEELSLRFSDAPEVPMYVLRAMRLHAQGGDPEATIRSGLRFLGEFPGREEATEAAAVVGPLLEERKEFARAGDLYEGVASRFPKKEASPRFLFHAARLAEDHGSPEAAERRFSAFRVRYPSPDWMWTYATLYVGLEARRREDTKNSNRLLEEGLRKVDGGVEIWAHPELAELTGKARIAVGESWAEQFRNTRLVVPLEKSLAVKDRFFRLALDAFAKAESGSPLELSLQATQLSGDLFMEFGKAILASQRPKGLEGSDLEEYEEALMARARSFFERSADWYARALDRLEKAGGAPDLGVPIRKRQETAQSLLEGMVSVKGGRVK
jgi:hypothetical protein